jgi:hypothetical protein
MSRFAIGIAALVAIVHLARRRPRGILTAATPTRR